MNNLKLSALSNKQKTNFQIGNLNVGRDFLMIAGPCSVESEYQTLKVAEAVKEAGANILRGGAFKPRTSPYAFQGLGLQALKILRKAKDLTGMPIVSEVLDPRDVSWMCDYVDVLQIGARNMQNFSLLTQVGKVRIPVLLKRGMYSTISEWLNCAEYILKEGNPDVILCERGIRTFETYSRNTLDLSAVPSIKELSHLPVIVDPAHATGKTSLIPRMCLAAVAAGVDGLIVEVHNNPEEALSDKDQALSGIIPGNDKKSLFVERLYGDAELKTLEIISELGRCSVFSDVSLVQCIQASLQDRHVLITDENVFRLYGKLFAVHPTIRVAPGEDKKNLKTLEMIFDRLIELEADRSTLLTGIGGGVVCDLTGAAASTYMRGLHFNLMPTSLLAQVDASIGGKNGINIRQHKNLVGTFNQPDEVYIDFHVLKSLPPREIVSGAAEVVKHALLSNPVLLSRIERFPKDLLSLKSDMIEDVILESIRIKAGIIEADARERGQRRLLNFGHTFGHAIERLYGLSHGEAVSLGMVMALHISVSRGFLRDQTKIRIIRLLEMLDLPIRFHLDKKKILDLVKSDKKKEACGIHFILLDDIGVPRIEQLSFVELEAHLNDLCKLETFKS